MVTCVVGCQWGDEGKGKIVDFLSQQADIVVRVQGGANAGHTVVVGQNQHILHLIPAGILNPLSACVIGHGVVVDSVILIEEINLLQKNGIDLKGRLFISSRAHLVMPYHKLFDMLREKNSSRKIGTTGRGIGPAYADKVGRTGIRTGDLVSPDRLRQKITANVAAANQILKNIYGEPEISAEDTCRQYLEYGEKIRAYIADTETLLGAAVKANKVIILEGAQGALLDLDVGTYPYVTSSNATAGGAATGSGIGPTKIDKVIGIVKAYTTRVGEGPLPTELAEEESSLLRQRGHEFGATTGRPRRCGWFDAPVAKFASMVNGADELVITKLDVLDNLPVIKICSGYRLRGEILQSFPADIEDLAEVEPVYEELPGWQEDTTGINEFNGLPENAKNYLNRMEQLVEVPIKFISVGAERSQTITKTHEQAVASY